MKLQSVGRPKNPPGHERRTLVLDGATVELLEALKERFEERWDVPPTLSLLVARGLAFASEEIIETPPEHERLRVAQAHLRHLKVDVENAVSGTRDALFAVYGEITQQMSRIPGLQDAVRRRKSEWPGWTQANAACGQIMLELNELHDRVSRAMTKHRK